MQIRLADCSSLFWGQVQIKSGVAGLETKAVNLGESVVPKSKIVYNRRLGFGDFGSLPRRGHNLRLSFSVRHEPATAPNGVFGVMKLKFGVVKLRYRGLKKNANRLFATCALVNMFMVRKNCSAGSVVSPSAERSSQGSGFPGTDELQTSNIRTSASRRLRLNTPKAVLIQRFPR